MLQKEEKAGTEDHAFVLHIWSGPLVRSLPVGLVGKETRGRSMRTKGRSRTIVIKGKMRKRAKARRENKEKKERWPKVGLGLSSFSWRERMEETRSVRESRRRPFFLAGWQFPPPTLPPLPTPPILFLFSFYSFFLLLSLFLLDGLLRRYLTRFFTLATHLLLYCLQQQKTTRRSANQDNTDNCFCSLLLFRRNFAWIERRRRKEEMVADLPSPRLTRKEIWYNIRIDVCC